MRPLFPAATALILLTLASTASASEASRLFDEGVKLLDEGRVTEACPKLEASQRLEPAAGTLLNLAGCYERSGRRALALATFRAAADAAHARGRADWQRVADEHAQALAAVVPILTITPADPRAALEIRVDGTVITEPSLPVEPGTHAIKVTSPGKKPFAVSVPVAKSTVVLVPALDPLPAREPPAREPPPSPGLGTRRTVGLALAGVGVAALAFAGVSTLVAAGALDDAKASCPSYPTRCTSAATDPNDRASTWSTIATVSAIAGVALAAGGAALFFVPSSDGARVALSASF